MESVSESVVGRLRLTDYHPADTFERDILAGLSAREKSTPAKHLYDRRGSELFDQICELDEYYLTRAEMSIMRASAGEMAAALGDRVHLIELGAGSGTKTRLLLDACVARGSVRSYAPVDISREFLIESARRIADEYRSLDVLPVCADFTQPFEVPAAVGFGESIAVYFPGSTIGNLDPDDAASLLVRTAALCGEGGVLLIGIDLIKDVETLESAYDDAQGVTRAFNSNLFVRINRELDADIDTSQFEYRARWDRANARIAMSQVSRRDQEFTVRGRTIRLDEGEEIRTERSHKYDVRAFVRAAADAGFESEPRGVWTDERERFAVVALRSRGAFEA